ncbi:MAG TPA: MFS transporter [Acetobacteraceae bacterium]|jgi:ACS family hexuronate transporter-like MFS transporter|nr:MFS transporter [Acetobacteraceae bacterium]
MLAKLRWQMASLLFLAGIINYLDRAALSVAAPLVSRDLHLGPGALGLIFSSFFLGYALFNFVGGWAADRFGAKRVFAMAMALWSLFCGLTAAATGFASLFVIRVIFGIGEGPLCATMNKLVNNWFPHREAGTAIGFVNCGTPLGGAIAGPLVGLIAASFGWRVSFVAIGLLGFLWLGFWVARVAERPAQHPRISAAEQAEILEDRPISAEGPARPLGFYLRQPTVLATAIAFFGYNYILFFFLTWFPSYLTMARHLSLHDMSLATALPWTLGFIGLLLGGWVSDLVFRGTGRPLYARKLVLTVCLAIAALCVALAGLVTTVASALGLMAAAVFFLYLTGSTYWAIVQDTVRGENVGGVGGFIHAVANCAGIIGPAVTGFIVQYTGAFTSAFVLAGGIAVVGVLAVTMLVRPLASGGGVARPVLAAE